jgi:hypothetical protein
VILRCIITLHREAVGRYTARRQHGPSDGGAETRPLPSRHLGCSIQVHFTVVGGVPRNSPLDASRRLGSSLCGESRFPHLDHTASAYVNAIIKQVHEVLGRDLQKSISSAQGRLGLRLDAAISTWRRRPCGLPWKREACCGQYVSPDLPCPTRGPEFVLYSSQRLRTRVPRASRAISIPVPISVSVFPSSNRRSAASITTAARGGPRCG